VIIIVIGEKILRFKSIDSTNDFVKTNSKSLDNGTIVVSDEQVKGRGRSNHLWMSEKGNLYFSFIIKDNVARMDVFKYIVNNSMAIIRLLRGFNIKSEIKYPNDILVEDKKICGILIESYGSLEIDYVVVGVGININQLYFKELNDKAVSMRNILNFEIDNDKVLEKFITYYNQLDGIPFVKLFDEYLRCSMIIGKKANIKGTVYLIKGINEEGKLIVENNNNIEYINLNEISIKDLY